MDQQRINALIELMASNDLVELDICEHDCHLKLYRDGAAAPATAAAPNAFAATPAATSPPPASGATIASPPPASGTTIASPVPVDEEPQQGGEVVCAPFYGVLHLTPAPDQPPFVRVGDTIEAGQTLGLLEAMKMFHSITAACRGTLQAILSEPGQEVETDQPLFRIH
ncbi:Acetyl-CoA carboxylase, biotin carboxyl carrier protein [Sodalis praecaptivus]|uniref:Biotin carboxyl carrier protein of acetyl-CoA carboxylase n=1 Tax=Sodalis praecaptivus TaxID=1239307 RepID=W0HS47_9GAMM|nr:acetyl-CoA carboxylase biotin carboxyl carrier protein subunit [Sodalis praecaptivus]AHF76604.1 Acetyl-CoA carboxylase, biotin carboxyl carrier protein [Sodalis praecaptivus]